MKRYEPMRPEETDPPELSLDAYLFKDNLLDLILVLMEDGDWTIPPEVEEEEFAELVFQRMRAEVSSWVRQAARYFLDNSEYFLSTQEALEIFDEELRARNVQVSDAVRQAFLEFLYRDFPNFCSQAIQRTLEELTVQKL
ncbi:MAG: hypothetical protein KatS3mg115_0968 [Candidatus Poribacteria bacterium]|nr:MAG: hypothetical protein KatS3mg115_0968 [Candidatus Poribacteria bacterium]